jgi:hypothetical protein
MGNWETEKMREEGEYIKDYGLWKEDGGIGK